MTIAETGAVMDVLTIAYPKFNRPLDKKKQTMMLWAEMFAEDDVSVVLAAVKALIATKTDDWPPSVGAVKEYIHKLTEPTQMTEGEAWAIVSRAVRKTDWNHPEVQYNQLPADIQASVGSAHTLVEWGMAEESTFTTVIASNFMRSYRAKRKASHDHAALPGSVKTLVGEYAKKLQIGQGDGT